MLVCGVMWQSCLLVFIASACTLVIELIAGRIMAPYVGVSLYTWTSIIGIVLAGMSVGNYLGGVVADRQASRRTLGTIFIAGSVACLLILVITDFVIGQTFRLSLLPRIVVYTTAIFLLPSLVLGMVSPLVVKLALADLQRTGNTVGTIYAFSTAGSILGTFLTGFWLISWLGTRSIVWIVAGVLLLTGLAVGRFHRSRGGRIANGLVVPVVALAIFGFVWQGWSAGKYRAPCEVESNYYCIQINETFENGKPARALMLDRLIHSFVVLDDPTALGYGYERAYADLTQMQLSGRPHTHTLFIGGGGYSFPRYIDATYPNAAIDVIEIDPEVTTVAHNQLGLGDKTRIRSFNQDARTFLLEWPDPQQYDVVFGDAFNDLSIPYHLTTVEFNRIVQQRMKPDGIYLVNVIDKFEDGEFLKAYANGLRAVFPYVYLFGRGSEFLPFDRNTYVLMASGQPLNRPAFDAITSNEGIVDRTTALGQDRLNAYLKSGRALTLTDDFAPVDQLLARLFIERGN
jgi:spermidine synthase